MLIVAGFIALLNVAVISPLLGQTPVEPASGVTAVTVGGVREGGGPPLLESGSPHPVIPTVNRNAVIQTWLIFNLRISFSSLPSYNASSAATVAAAAEKHETPGFAGFLVRTQSFSDRSHDRAFELFRLFYIEQSPT
jgi:hypothetical protein